MGFFSCFLGLNPHNFAKDYTNVKNKYIYIYLFYAKFYGAKQEKKLVFQTLKFGVWGQYGSKRLKKSYISLEL